jgi:hypothetical protein
MLASWLTFKGYYAMFWRAEVPFCDIPYTSFDEVDLIEVIGGTCVFY